MDGRRLQEPRQRTHVAHGPHAHRPRPPPPAPPRRPPRRMTRGKLRSAARSPTNTSPRPPGRSPPLAGSPPWTDAGCAGAPNKEMSVSSSTPSPPSTPQPPPHLDPLGKPQRRPPHLDHPRLHLHPRRTPHRPRRGTRARNRHPPRRLPYDGAPTAARRRAPAEPTPTPSGSAPALTNTRTGPHPGH